MIWIKCSDSLPPENSRVMLKLENGHEVKGWYKPSFYEPWWYENTNVNFVLDTPDRLNEEDFFLQKIFEWKPLPEPPEKE